MDWKQDIFSHICLKEVIYYEIFLPLLLLFISSVESQMCFYPHIIATFRKVFHNLASFGEVLARRTYVRYNYVFRTLVLLKFCLFPLREVWNFQISPWKNWLNHQLTGNVSLFPHMCLLQSVSKNQVLFWFSFTLLHTISKVPVPLRFHWATFACIRTFLEKTLETDMPFTIKTLNTRLFSH